MMAQAGQRKCLNCARYFIPDRRVGTRQQYCCGDACQKVSKLQSHQHWLAQPQNRDYFHGPVHVARVQAWRRAHPDYARRSAPARALQDECPSQPVDPAQESANRTLPSAQPLQDLMSASSPILAGLIAHVFQVTLQDEMAATARRLVQLGTDVLGGIDHGQTQADPAAAAPAAGAPAVLLD